MSADDRHRTGPDPAGKAALAAAAAELARGPVKAPPPHRPVWRRPRSVAVFLAADLLVGTVLLRWVGSHQDSPTGAVEHVVALAARGDWAGVRGRLCGADRDRLTEQQLADAGRAAALTLRGIDHAEVTDVEPASLPVDLPVLGVVGLPVRQVRGRLLASLGPPSTFSVITVRELGGWRVCLSVGGYASSALGIDVPIGGADQAPVPGGGDSGTG